MRKPIAKPSSTLVPFRSRGGERRALPEVSATEAKNEFGRVLELAMQRGAVAITRHNAPKAVLLSVDEFNALASAKPSALDTLTATFDTMLAKMQTKRARKAMRSAFDASPAELGRAAVAAAAKRG